MQTRVYPLGELLAGPFGFDHRDVGEMIQSLVSPHDWEPVGGQGVIEIVPGAVVVSHTATVHDEIVNLLRQLAKMNLAEFESISLDDEDAERRRIESRLQQTTSLEFWEATLEHALDWIGKEHNLPIVIDRRALTDVGIAIDDQLTLRLREVTLESALANLLHNFDLSYHHLTRSGLSSQHRRSPRSN